MSEFDMNVTAHKQLNLAFKIFSELYDSLDYPTKNRKLVTIQDKSYSLIDAYKIYEDADSVRGSGGDL
jgi:hypothetical protein